MGSTTGGAERPSGRMSQTSTDILPYEQLLEQEDLATRVPGRTFSSPAKGLLVSVTLMALGVIGLSGGGAQTSVGALVNLSPGIVWTLPFQLFDGPPVLGAPVLALAPPGQTQIQDQYLSLPLVQRLQATPDVVFLRFGLPNQSKPLGLSTLSCILFKGLAGSGLEEVVRPYTPVSTNAEIGTFTLLVKVYPDGAMSGFLGAMAIGARILATHTAKNVKQQYPFAATEVAMIAGGTGITPMLQALQALLGNSSDTTRVTLLYSNRRESDIIARSTLDEWLGGWHDRVRIVYTLSREPPTSSWVGRRGRIDRRLIEEWVPPPSANVLVFVCGPDGLYEAFTGPRQGEYSGILAEMGYAESQVVKL